ncbi:related to ATP synthase subunit 5, mitochondrial [Hanseniaspora guilliermondii]|uniref:ATP synthase subunit 5, mitochondrial n=1 Tax=Hanseniaspora guilliermondii TaxID=56406 RepID=A0A1L0FPM3_9ASCO|nr:related to ATP synthase subunit 5, mitochondrial [Hanseniaspora guilliermondii]
MFSITSKKLQAAVKVPVQLFNLEGVYATSLYKSAVSLNKYDESYKSLKFIDDVLANEKGKVASLISNPTLNTEARNTIVETLGSNAATPVKNFLNVLAENNRLSLLPSIISDFEKLNQAHKKIVNCKIYSAKPLSTFVLNRINKAITKSKFNFVAKGGKLEVENIVKPEVLGGFIVEINNGEKLVDLSVSSKITKLNAVLNESI